MTTRKILSLILVALMLVTAVFSATVTSSASFDSDKIVVSSFSTMTQNYSKPEGWYNDIGFWGQKTNVSTNVDENGALTLTVSAGDYNYYRQVMSNWSGVQPTTQTAYIDITNNSPKAVRMIITVGGYTSPAEADLPKVAAGATKTIELGVLTGGSFNIMFQEQYGGDFSCATPNDFILSPIYTEPFVEETTVTEPPTLPEGIEAVYSFASANHNYSKSEGCNPNNGWAWGSFATTTPDYKANGAVSFDLEAGAYNKFRQFQTNWRNVPAEDCVTYVDITNNTTRSVKVRITTAGYTTPSDANLPQIKAGETITIELGALTGGSFGVMFLDLHGSDEIPCGDDVFTISGIYKKAGSVPIEKHTFSFTKLEFNATLTPADGAGAFSVTQHKDGDVATALTTSRTLVVGDKLDFVSKASLPAGKYKVDLQYRAYTGRAQLNVVLDGNDYGTFTSATSGGTGTILNLFKEVSYKKEGPVSISFEALSAGSIYIEALVFTKVGEVEATYYNVTVNGETTSIEEGAEFSLPVMEDLSFVGYYYDGKIYNAKEIVTVDKDITFQSLYLDMEMLQGAAFRLSKPTGIRFYTNIDEEQLAALEALGMSVQLGTVVAPIDHLDGNDLTFDIEKTYTKIAFNTRNWYKETDFSGFVGSIVSIKDKNLNRKFVGRGYATITFGDFEKTIYADYSTEDNARSICYIANMLKNDTVYETLSTELQEVVDSFASKFVE